MRTQQTGPRPCGIVWQPTGAIAGHLGGKIHIPLEQLNAHVEIVDVSATITLTQTFWQCSPTPTAHAMYIFPLPARAAVCQFEMRTEDGRVVTAVAKERETARREHEEAIRQGQITGLVEHVTDDVFTISLGCLPQLQMITTKLTYVMDLMDDDFKDQVRFQLPVSVGMRFGSIPTEMVEAKTIPADRIKISIGVHMKGAIQSIESPSHSTLIVLPESVPSVNRRMGQFRSSSFLSEDFVLSIKADGLDDPRCFAERSAAGTVALQLTVVPHFKLPPIPAQEYIFLVDRSGSMRGEKIEMAKRALMMLLRALPRQDTTFNILSFGNRCSSLWEESMPYNAQTLQEATEHVDSMDANYGGTQIRLALDHMFSIRCVMLPTACFMLTDGQAWDIDATLASVKAAVSTSRPEAPLRVFTLGIGERTSTAMCEGIARTGSGACLMASTADTIVAKCAKLVKASRAEILREVTVNWGFSPQPADSQPSDPQNTLLRQAPHTIPPVYNGVRFALFAIIGQSPPTIPVEVVLQGKSLAGAALSFTIPVDELTGDNQTERPLIHTLAARRLIMDLEDSEKVAASPSIKAAVIHLGEQYQLASRYTSFIAVEDPKQPTLNAAVLSERTVDAQIRLNSIPAANSSTQHDTTAVYARQTADQAMQQQILRSAARAIPTAAIGTSRTVSPRQSPPSEAANAGSAVSTEGSGRTMLFSAGNSAPMYFMVGEPASPALPSAQHTDLDPATDVDFNNMSWTPRGRHASSNDNGSHPVWNDLRFAAPQPMRVAAARSRSGDKKASARRPVQTVPSSEEDVVRLVRLQTFDGSFPSNAELTRIVGQKVLAEAEQLHVDETVWATVVAIAYLRKYLVGQSELLESLVEKAQEFVEQTSGVDFQRLLQLAIALEL